MTAQPAVDDACALLADLRLAALDIDRILVAVDVRAWRLAGGSIRPSLAHRVSYLCDRLRVAVRQLSTVSPTRTGAESAAPAWPPPGLPPAERPARLIRRWRAYEHHFAHQCASALTGLPSPAQTEAIAMLMRDELNTLQLHRWAMEELYFDLADPLA